MCVGLLSLASWNVVSSLSLRLVYPRDSPPIPHTHTHTHTLTHTTHMHHMHDTTRPTSSVRRCELARPVWMLLLLLLSLWMGGVTSHVRRPITALSTRERESARTPCVRKAYTRYELLSYLIKYSNMKTERAQNYMKSSLVLCCHVLLSHAI